MWGRGAKGDAVGATMSGAKGGKQQATEGVEVTIEEWRRLHEKEFADQIKDRVWGTIWKVIGGTSIVAIVSLLGLIYVPIKNDIVNSVTKDVARGFVGEVRKEVEAQAQAAATDYIRRAIVGRSANEADNELRRMLDDAVKGMLVGNASQKGLVREALVGEAKGAFLAGTDVTQRAYMFRLLNALDAVEARDALAEALLKRIQTQDAQMRLQEHDEVFVRALEELTQNRLAGSAASSADTAIVLLRRVITFLQLMRVGNSDREQQLSGALLRAAADWIRTLQTEQDVANYLVRESVPDGRGSARQPVAFDLLLRQRTEPALRALAAILSATEHAAEAEQLLRHLADSPWPQMDPRVVTLIFKVIESRVPDSALGSALTPAALEYRFAMTQAAAQAGGNTYAQQLLNLPPARAKGVTPSYWHESIDAIGSATQAARALGNGSIAAAIIDLPLVPSQQAQQWSLLMARVVGALKVGPQRPDGQPPLPTNEDLALTFVRDLLESQLAGQSQMAAILRDRRIGLLALGIASAAFSDDPEARKVMAALRKTLLERLLAHPDLDTSPVLGAALQRVLPGAVASDCLNFANTSRAKAPWVNAALLACASRDAGEASIAALAARINKVSGPELLRLIGLRVLAAPPASFQWPDARASQTSATAATMVLAAITGPDGKPDVRTPAALTVLATVRLAAEAGTRVAIDRQLSQLSLQLYPAPENPPNALPEWAYTGFWAGAQTFDRSIGTPWSHQIGPTKPAILKLPCTPGNEVILRVREGRRDSTSEVLRIVEGRPVQQALRFGEQAVLSQSVCSGEEMVIVSASTTVMIELSGRRPAQSAAFASAFERRGEADPLVPNRPVRIVLERDQEAHFALLLDPKRVYTVQTRNLVERTDTVLAVLDVDGRILREDDDGVDGSNASLLRLSGGEVACAIGLRASTFGGDGGTFDLVLADVGANDLLPSTLPRLALPAQETRTLDADATIEWRIALSAGERIRISTSALGRGVDSELTLRDPTGCAEIDRNDDGGAEGLASQIVFVVPDDGEYIVQLKNIGRPGPITLEARTMQ
jgi:hypothetical protein